MTPTPMQALVTALEGILNFDTLMANFTALVPAIGGVVIFAFTYRIVRRMVTGASKGKAKI